MSTIDLRDVTGKHITVTGGIPGLTRGGLEILLEARGVAVLSRSPGKLTDLVIAPEDSGKKVDKARALGLPIVVGDEVRAALGEPLEGFRARFQAKLAKRPKFYKDAVLHLGDPAPAQLLERVAERVGFALPLAARNLFSQLNGLSYLWSTRKMPAELAGPLAWHDTMDQDGAIWRTLLELSGTSKGSFSMGLIAIPDLETIFFSEWDERLFISGNYGPKDRVTIGKKRAKARDFWGNLFLFDAFHGYYQAGLWADPVSEEFYVVYGSDYGADWGWSSPIPLEIYMEHLCARFGAGRIIDPAVKAGMTSSMRRTHSWYELNPYCDL